MDENMARSGPKIDEKMTSNAALDGNLQNLDKLS